MNLTWLKTQFFLLALLAWSTAVHSAALSSISPSLESALPQPQATLGSSSTLTESRTEIHAPSLTAHTKRARPVDSSRMSSLSEDEQRIKAGSTPKPSAAEIKPLDVDSDEEEPAERSIKRQKPESAQLPEIAPAASGSSSRLAEEKKRQEEEAQQAALARIQAIASKKRALLPDALQAIDRWWLARGTHPLTPAEIKEETQKYFNMMAKARESLERDIKTFSVSNPSQQHKDAVAVLTVSRAESERLNRLVMEYFPVAPTAFQYKQAQATSITKAKQAVTQHPFFLSATASAEEKEKMLDGIIKNVDAQLKELLATPKFRKLAQLSAPLRPYIMDAAAVKALLLAHIQKTLVAPVVHEEKKIKSETYSALETLVQRKRMLLPNALNALDAWWQSQSTRTLSPELSKKVLAHHVGELEKALEKLERDVKTFTALNLGQAPQDTVATLTVSPTEKAQLLHDIKEYFSIIALVTPFKKEQATIITKGKQALDAQLSYLDHQATPAEKTALVDRIVENVATQLRALIDTPTFAPVTNLSGRIPCIRDNNHAPELLLTYVAQALPTQTQREALPEEINLEIGSSLHTTHVPLWLTDLYGIDEKQTDIVIERNDTYKLSGDQLTFIVRQEQDPGNLEADQFRHNFQVVAYDQDKACFSNIFTFAGVHESDEEINFNGSVIVQTYDDGKIVVFKRTSLGYTGTVLAGSEDGLAKKVIGISDDGKRFLVACHEGHSFSVYNDSDGTHKLFFTSKRFENAQEYLMSRDSSTIIITDLIHMITTIYKYDGTMYTPIFSFSRDDDELAKLQMNVDGSIVVVPTSSSLKTLCLVETGYALSPTTYKKIQEVPLSTDEEIWGRSTVFSTFHTISNKSVSVYKMSSDNCFYRWSIPHGFIFKGLSPDGNLLALIQIEPYPGVGNFSVQIWQYDARTKCYKKFSTIAYKRKYSDESWFRFKITNLPGTYFTIPTNCDDIGENLEVKLWVPSLKKELYAQLTQDQLDLLYELYMVHRTRTKAEVIHLNKGQSDIWRSLPPLFASHLALYSRTLFVRHLLSPQEAALKDILAKHEKTVMTLLDSTPLAEKPTLVPLMLKMLNLHAGALTKSIVKKFYPALEKKN